MFVIVGSNVVCAKELPSKYTFIDNIDGIIVALGTWHCGCIDKRAEAE